MSAEASGGRPLGWALLALGAWRLWWRATHPYSWPVAPDQVLRSYGPIHKADGKDLFHCGIDLAVPVGTPVLAAAAGVVRVAVGPLAVPSGYAAGRFHAGQHAGYGFFVELLHDDGTTTRYGHLSVIGVEQGQQVEQGEQIALSGATGHAGKGAPAHLHFEVRTADGRHMDPEEVTS